MFLNPKSEIARLTKIPLLQFILLNLQTSLEDFFSFWSTNRDVTCDLFVPSNSKMSDCVTSFGGNGSLTSELFQYL
jgi:hypothetical protein